MNNQEKNVHNKVDLDDIVKNFRLTGIPKLLSGGQGLSYLCGNTVIKPVDDAEESTWTASVFFNLSSIFLRIPKPVRATDGNWIYKGWCAYSFIDGETTKKRWSEKINVGREFHSLLQDTEKPSFLEKRTHPWAIADKMVWGESKLKYSKALAPVVSRLLPFVQEITLPSQIIHGDLSGNILFHLDLKPGVIDFSPYWRPAEYATAIIIVDSMVWEHAPIDLLNEMPDTEQMNQLLIRAALWRIITTEQCSIQFGAGNIDDVLAYQPFIDELQKRKNI